MRRPEVTPEQRNTLQQDLQRKLDQVGKHGYARATAKDFAKGGKYNPESKKPRYALT